MSSNQFESQVNQARNIIRQMKSENMPSQDLRQEIQEPEGDNAEFGRQVEEARKAIRELKAKQEPEYTYGERAAQVGRGFLQGAAGMSEALGPSGGSLYSDPALEELERLKLEESRGSGLIPARESAGELVNKLYGKDLEPTDKTGKFLHGVGEFMVPTPIPAPIGGAGIKALGKYAGRHALAGTGASAALVTPRIAEEGTIPGAAEDVLKTMIGASAGAKVPGAVAGLGKLSAQAVRHPVESLTKAGAAAATKITGLKPDKEILDLAAKHEIELPPNVGGGSTRANWIANNYLKSVFAGKKYKEMLQRSSDSTISAVRKSIDTLGEGNPLQHEASQGFSEYLKEQEKIFKGQSDKLYDSARKSLSKNDTVIPSNTFKALESEPVKELLSTISPSSSEKQVISRIKEISSKLSPQTNLDVSESFLKAHGPKMAERLKGRISSKQEVPVSELINLRKSLLNTINYETDIRGSEAFLSKLINTIDSDIKNVKNKDFLKNYESANSFFKQNIGKRFRISMAQSLMRNEAPVDAFNLMNSVKNVKILERIAGESPKGKEIFDSLKKAKVRQMLGNAVEGDLKSEGTLRTGQFSNLFESAGKEGNQELLKKLIGDREYRNLKEIAQVSREFQKSGRELLNTSGTAHVLSDIKTAEDVAKETIKSIAWLAGGTSTGGLSGLTLASMKVASPWAVARLAASPKFVSYMRQYALAKKAGKTKYADDVILKKMVITAVKEIEEAKKARSEGKPTEDTE